MKKTLILILVLCLAVLPVMAETAVDAVTSASVADYYADGMLSGDDLMNAINSYTGFYAVASVNPDGTPNIAYFVYGMQKIGSLPQFMPISASSSRLKPLEAACADIRSSIERLDSSLFINACVLFW